MLAEDGGQPCGPGSAPSSRSSPQQRQTAGRTSPPGSPQRRPLPLLATCRRTRERAQSRTDERAHCLTYRTLAFVEAKANAALLGPPGVGKTHIAVALAVAACRAGFSVYFTTLDDMVRQLKVAEVAGRLNTKLRTYLRPGVLVVDEVGYQPLDRAEANLVFQVISKRYEKSSIILTSNKTFSEWGAGVR